MLFEALHRFSLIIFQNKIYGNLLSSSDGGIFIFKLLSISFAIPEIAERKRKNLFS